MYERFARIIEKAKNKSAVLRYIGIEHTAEAGWVATTGMTVQEERAISNDIHIDNPDQAMYLMEYISVGEEAQAVDATIVGGLDTIIEENFGLTYTCILTVSAEMAIGETLTETSIGLNTQAISEIATASEQAIRSNL